MKLKGSLLTLIFTLLVALTVSVTAFADPISGTCGTSGVTYEIGDNQTLTVSGSGEMPDYGASDAPWSAYATSIFNIVITDGVTAIGDNAFVNVQADEVSIPNSVDDIGQYALGYSYSGGSYTKIPGFTIVAASGTVAEIYAENNGFTFKSTTPQALEGICGDGVTYKLTVDGVLTISGNGAMYSFASENTPWYKYVSGDRDYVIREVKILDGVTCVGQNAFYGCTSLHKVTLSSSVTEISDKAFASCTALSEVNLTSSVVSIGNEAFSYCTELKTISLSEGLEMLGDKVFSQSGLTKITLPSSLKTTGETLFYGCTSLTEATVNCTTVPPRIFAECTALHTVTLTETVESIGEYAFEGCVSLDSVTSTESLISVGPYAFEGCTSLTDIRFESSVVDFGYYCFKDCTGLQTFAFTDSVKIIPEGMFYGCTSLSQVSLGDNIESIGNYAFVDCKDLGAIFISYKVKYIGLYALGYTYSDGYYHPIKDLGLEIEGFTPSVAKLYAEEHDLTFIPYKTVDTDLGNITDDIVWKFRPSTGVLNIIGQGTMPDYLMFEETPWYVYKTYIKQVTFSNGILNIGSCSFEGCTTIEKIDIPGSVQTIGTSAFAGTSIITANIPNGVREIANSAFEGCGSLYNVSLPNTLEYVGEAAFRGPNIMTSVFIPQSIIEIGANAFGFNANNTVINGFYVKGIEGSIANTYADQNGLDFVVNGYVEIADEDGNCKISILGDSTIGYTLEFNKLQAIFNPTLLIPSDQTIIQYEIKLKYNNAAARFDGSAEISFAIPEGMTNKILYVYSVADNGEFISINFTNTDGRIVFSNSALGKYVVSTVDLSTLYRITINYLYSDGTPAKEPLYVRATNGAQYRFTAENIKGYSLNEYAFSGAVSGADVTIEFIYTKSAVSAPSGNGGGSATDGAGTKVLLTVFLIILIIALIAAVILLIYINDRKKKQQKETGKTINAAAKKPAKPDAMAETIVVPDFATREIDIESLFADEPEEDLDAEENLRKK